MSNLTSELGNGIIVGLKPATTWDTAVQAVANDGFYARTVDIDEDISKVEVDHLNNQPVASPSILGWKKYNIRLSLWGNARSGLPQLFGSLAGADSVTAINNSDPAQVGSIHRMILQQAAGRMLTFAAYYPRLDLVREIPTMVVTEITLQDSPNGGLQVTVGAWGSKEVRSDTGSPTNTTASMSGTLTIPDPLWVPEFNDLVLRINNFNESTALDSDDQFPHAGYTLRCARAYKDRVDGSSRPYRAHPQSGIVTVELTVPREGLDDMDLADYVKNYDPTDPTTACMADLIYSGPLLTDGDAGQVHRVAAYLPYLEPGKHTDPVSNRDAIDEEVSFMGKLAPATPASFSARVPYMEFDNELTTAYYS